MHPRLAPIESVAQLESLLTSSDTRPVLLFKHSRSCGASAQALDELIEHLDTGSNDVHYAMVTVQTHREVSTAAARVLGIRHETPQALLIQDGRAVWNASHFRVTAEAVEAAVRRLQRTDTLTVS
jgi:bacillithiol system protein YtxJ